jgi:protein O-mannosyl-transferase
VRPGRGGRRGRALIWEAALLVAVVAAGVYANSLDGALIYDDTNAIVRNTRVQALDPVAIFTQPSWWREGFGRGWRPVTTLSFAVDYAVHGLAPRGYHLVNVALHAGVSALVLVVFTRVTGAAVAALIAALLFAVHPVHTEAVASVVGRSELLAAAGVFLAWLCFERADAGKGRWLEVLGVTTFLAAMLAKENAVTLLPVLVLADLLYPMAGASGVATLRRRLPRYLALGAVTAAFIAARAAVIGPHSPGIEKLDNPLVTLPLVERLLTAVKVVGLYAWRLVFPLRLAADYSYPQIAAVSSPADPGFLAGLAVIVAVAGGAWWARRRIPAVTLGLGFLLLTFGLVANFLFLIGTIMAERLVYLPSAGFCLVVGTVLAWMAGLGECSVPAGAVVSASPADGARPAALRALAARPALLAVVVALTVLGAVRTWTRNTVWHDPETFFTTMVAEAPRSARSQRELGTVLAELGRHDEARRAFERSLALKPDDPATLHNFGNALVRAGRLDEAAAVYERAVARKPDFTDAIMNLATVESERGDQETAVRWLQRALAIEPRSVGVHMNLANTLFRAGRLDEAQVEYEAALALAPADENLLTNYATFLYARGDYDGAIGAYERAARSSDLRALLGLAASYRARGMIDAARATLARADQRYPGNAAVRDARRRLGATPSAGGGA